MREYELIFIVKATETDEAIEAIIEQMQAIAASNEAEVTNVDRWGRRRLAYEIAKEREGFYVMFEMRASETAIKELERRLRMIEVVLRYMTVRVDDEMRRAARRASLRAKGKKPTQEALDAAMAATPADAPAADAPAADAPAADAPAADAPAAAATKSSESADAGAGEA